MTAYAEIPLTTEIGQAVAAQYGVPVAPEQVSRLHGGEESAAYRAGAHVVRIGPAWRPSARIEWCHTVAARAAAAGPEFLAPLSSKNGHTVIRVGGRPVTLWRHVPGEWADDRNRDHRRQAAVLLAQLHRATAAAPAGDCEAAVPELTRRPQVPEVTDPELEAWLAGFDRRQPARQPLHGDYYAGNTLVAGGRIVAVLDWDEAYLGPPQREAAHGAWEWGDGLSSGALDGAREFLAGYAAAGGPGADMDDITLRQLIRERLRNEVRWARSANELGVRRDGGDETYTRAQVQAFWQLRPGPAQQ